MRQVLLKVDFETARQDVASRAKLGKQIPTNVDLPLSDHAKRALIYAAQEADRLNHRHIGTAHLWLGLGRDKEFASAEFLSRFGADLESLRKRVEALGEQTSSPPSEELRHRDEGYLAALRRPPSSNTVEIHGVKRILEHIEMSVSRCREYAWHWEQKPWKARDIVMKKDGKGFSFDLTLATEDSSKFKLLQGGWKKDQCAICRWELFESDDASASNKEAFVAGCTNPAQCTKDKLHISLQVAQRKRVSARGQAIGSLFSLANGSVATLTPALPFFSED